MHYLRYLAVAEIERVGRCIGLLLSDEQATLVARTARSESRHNHFALADLIRAKVAPRVTRLNRQLCVEAGTGDGNGRVVPAR